MNKTLKKTLSIILTVLMIVTTVPLAFAADETPDFSDAKILTVNSDGILCIDGVAVNSDSFGSLKEQYIPDGKYKLSGDISTGYPIHFHTDKDSDVIIDLNGYTWNSRDFVLYVQGSFSVYDTSAQKTGKIISDRLGTIFTYTVASEINLYSGTLENIDITAARDDCVINLYGGKIKSDNSAIFCNMEYSYIVNLYDTVLEISEGTAHIETSLLPNYTAQAVINVADYTGDDLTISVDINSAGKIKILQGVKNAEEAEKYTVVLPSEVPSYYLERTEYNEETGELFAYVVANAFTQQPSAENDYTVDFNNPDATFQWYEAEKTVLTPENTTAFDGVTFENGKWYTNGYYELFTVSVQAGDIIRASTNSDSSFNLDVYTGDYSTNETITFTKTGSVAINADAEVTVSIYSDNGWGENTEFDFELIRISETNATETEKKLQHPECEKTYCCIATVGESEYLSDVVTVVHDIVVDDEAVAPDCVNTGLTAASHCTRCDDMTVEQEVVLELGHDWSNKNGVCANDCGFECPHEGQSGSCKVCGANLGKLVIDLSEVTSSIVYIGNRYDYYDEDGYIITGTNKDVRINIYDSCDITFNDMSAKGVHLGNSAENVTVTLDGDNYMYGSFSVYRSHLTINGDEDDTLTIDSSSYAFTTSGNSGTLTVNGGKINAVTETTYASPTILCTGGFTLNGGEVTALNNYFYVIENKTIINGGTLNVISTSPNQVAIIGDVEIAKGALLTASAIYKVIRSDFNITPVNEAEENLSVFARFDKDSDFAPVSDIKAAIEDKTYAEIKVDTHEHDLDNSGKCICGYECSHESYADSKCEVCGYACPHESITDGICGDCGYECLHEGQSGSCKVCGVNLGKLVIDLSKVTVSSFTIGNGRTYYDEDGYIITGTNKNVKIKIFDSCDITFNNMSANSIILSSETASNVNVTLDGDNYMYGAFDVYQSHLTINGDDDDTLAIVSNTGAFFTAGYYPGTLTVNGGKINAVTETTDIFPTILCGGGFTLNGGEVTASNNYSYVIVNNKTIINGGTLNVISTSPYYEAIIGDVEIAKGALLTASATYKVIRSLDNITPVNEAEENLSLFARFDTDTDFVPVSDIKAALEGKTYAEIKVDTHEHSGGTATCVSGKICELCKAEYSEVDADAHDIVVDEAVAPTCTETGLTEGSHCSHCEDMTVEQEVIPDLGGHIDADGDYLCDNDCGHEFEKPVDPTPDTPDTPDEPADDTCDHLCHKDGILGFFWKIACFFFRLFNLQQYCDCGEIHYDAPILG